MKKFLTLFVALAAFLTVASSANAAFTYPETVNSVVLISIIDSQGDEYIGSGFLISSDALILTNSHVIWDDTLGMPSDDIVICLIDNEYSIPDCRYQAEVWAYEPDLDLALIAPAYELDEYGNAVGDYIGIVEDFGLPYVDLADYNPSLGDELSILGFPAASLTSSVTLTKGTVSGFTPLSMIFPEFSNDWVWEIETDATINPGNSGGPAYNEDERVVGVVQAISLEGTGGNYGYIISNDMVYLWFWDLVEQGALNQEFVETAFSNDFDTYQSEMDSYSDIDFSELQTFSDVDLYHPNYYAIDYLHYLGIIDGYPDGSFKPDGEINRAELMKMVVEMMIGTPSPTYNNCFPDVKNDWYAPYVCYAEAVNWVDGYPDGTFKPANNTNRVEAIKIILNAFFGGEENIPASETATGMPIDADPEAWYYPFLQYAITNDLVDLQHVSHYVVSSYNYHGGENMTRKEVAEMIYRLIDEEVAFVFAMVDAACATNGFPDPEDPEALEMLQDSFEYYGLSSDPEDIMALLEKYGENDDVLTGIGEGVLEMCPEVVDNLNI